MKFAKFLDPNLAEAAQLRISNWAGNGPWSGLFDSTAIPADVFVNWIQIYSYTPGQGPGRSNFTPLWRDDFNQGDFSRWWTANWTFDYAVNDYTSQNAAVRGGALNIALTHWSQAGSFREVPLDDGLTPPLVTPPVDSNLVAVPGRVMAVAYSSYHDLTMGNLGGACQADDVDKQLSTDEGGGCNIGWTNAGEWVEYGIVADAATEFDVSLRLASTQTGKTVKVQLDGEEVSGSITSPSKGWQRFESVKIPRVTLSAGVHRLRVVFLTGDVNLHFVDVVAAEGLPPAMVTGLKAVAGNGAVSLSWTASAGASSYKVLRSAGGSAAEQVATSSDPAYSDVAVVNGNTYAYRIVASNASGDADTSSAVSAKPMPPAAGLKALYKTGTVGAVTNGIRPLLQIVNNGTAEVPLSQVTVRYWYTNEGSKAQSYWCDWAQLGQSNIVAAFKSVSPARTGADSYLEIGFKPTAGSLAPGASTGEIQSRFSKSDWSDYVQSNDASFDAAKASGYGDWSRITVYRNDSLVWGEEP